MIGVAFIVAIFLSSVDAQLQAQSCSISCPGDPTLSSHQLENELSMQAGRPGKRGAIGPPGPSGAPGGRGQKGERGEGFDSKVLEDEIKALRNSITQLKRFQAVVGWFEASNGRWYKLFRTEKNFNEARALCKMHGASLAHVGMKSSSVISEVMRLLGTKKGDYAWIGVTDRAKEGTWVWEDGSTDPVVNWGPGEPNNGGSVEHCAQVYDILKFNDISCSAKLNVLCETERM